MINLWWSSGGCLNQYSLRHWQYPSAQVPIWLICKNGWLWSQRFQINSLYSSCKLWRAMHQPGFIWSNILQCIYLSPKYFATHRFISKIFCTSMKKSYQGVKVYKEKLSNFKNQLTGRVEFSILTGDPNWLEVLIFRYWRGIPTDLLDV